MKPIIYVCLCILLLASSACKENEHKTMILGEWKGSDWLLDGASSGRNAKAVHFNFVDSESYSARFGGDKESGSYRIVENKLYTTETGKLEKMVEIATLSTDSLIMDMNRVGQSEQLILLRKE